MKRMLIAAIGCIIIASGIVLAEESENKSTVPGGTCEMGMPMSGGCGGCGMGMPVKGEEHFKMQGEMKRGGFQGMRGHFGMPGKMRHGGFNKQGCMCGGKMGTMRGCPFLNIMTDEQKEQAKKMRIEHQRKMIAFEAEIKTVRLDIMELMSNDNPDEKKISDKVDQLSAAMGKIKKEQLGMFIKMKKMLTPEQLKKIKEFKKGYMGKDKGKDKKQNKEEKK